MSSFRKHPFDQKGRLIEDRFCECSDDDTAHDVSLEIIMENPESENRKYSHEPYRVTTCQVCGRRNLQRMNKV